MTILSPRLPPVNAPHLGRVGFMLPHNAWFGRNHEELGLSPESIGGGPSRDQIAPRSQIGCGMILSVTRRGIAGHQGEG
jgi:hypothetical protein